ncbi:MAG TPA: prepilin-type N-terminal cleavage/methylation domain-containing protein [Candidatus Udaeobacter sp.]|jgi:prepilin-type N-terminal cleavage/methylation domain-containing protein|nr:prepilin-type N-terminal cleavage/methylation domain-containing protein [Candidatus Udaeobacter sp.]
MFTPSILGPGDAKARGTGAEPSPFLRFRRCSQVSLKRSVARPESEERLCRSSGFTLLELLIVIGIIGLLLVLVTPAFKTIKGGTDVTSAAYTIKSALETARTYAKANNTYTWIGFKEVDVSQDPSASPQNAGPGRVAFAIVASKDGTRGYDVTNTSLPPSAWANYNNGGNLLAVGKLQYLNNIHLAGALNNADNMTRPNVSSNNYIIGLAPDSVTPFDWPLGSAIDAGQYSFKKVINFDPQGIARIQYSTNTDTISPYMEVGLQQTHGVTVDANSPNVVAIQVGGVGSNVTIYRP